MNNFMPYSYQNYNSGYNQQQRPIQNYQPQYAVNPQQVFMQQPIQQPIQQTMQIDMPIQSVVFATLKEAEAYILMPNTKGLFIDKTNGMIYEKVCGADGQSVITHYKKTEPNLTPINEDATKVEFVTKTDLKDFITVEEYKNLKEELKGLQGQIKDLKTILETKAEQPKKTKAENKTNKESE